VSEGEARQREVVAEAETKSRDIVGAAETQQREILDRLNTERSSVERRIDDLRSFERDYRSKLKSYIEGQLHELDGDGTGEAARPTPASAQGFGSN
jgi:vacuolar-type H+-ATPase subunit H